MSHHVDPPKTGEILSRIAVRHLHEIDGLRGVAIIAVIFHHLLSAPLSKLDPRLFSLSLAPVYTNGWLGVNLFFMLSGFVLYLPYAQERRFFRDRRDWLEFYKHRAARLLPMYFFSTLLIAAFTGLRINDSDRFLQAVGLMTFTLPFMPSHFSPSVNWALWSVDVEFLFGILFPALCVACLRYGAGFVLCVSLPISFIFRMLGHSMSDTQVTWLGDALMIGRLDEFLWGVFCAQLFVKGHEPRSPRTIVGMSALLLIPTLGALAITNHHHISSVYYAPLTSLVDVALFLLLVSCTTGKTRVSDALTVRPLRVVGMGCYSLYLWHMPMISALNLHIDVWTAPVLFQFFSTLIVVSAMSYRYIEFRRVDDWKSLFLIPSAKVAPGAERSPPQPTAGSRPEADARRPSRHPAPT